MNFDPEKHHRRSVRLEGYDYARGGAYFVTICTQDRICLFGEVSGGTMQLNDIGEMIDANWRSLPTRFAYVHVDGFVVMPNHIHGIILLKPPYNLDANAPSEAPSLGTVVGVYKSVTTVAYLQGAKTRRWPAFRERLWQRNYYDEHIIRSEEAYGQICAYIDANPARWATDAENPNRDPDSDNPFA